MDSVESAAGRRGAPAIELGPMIAVPALITLAVTALRLLGELQGWSSTFFSRAAGGGGSLVGISWLVPFFGAWFGWVLARKGAPPSRLGRAFGLTVLAIALLPLSGLLAARAGLAATDLRTLYVYAVVALVGVAVAVSAWPFLGRTLVAYGLAARVPVALVMLVAMLGNWGTHYDVAPPGLPAMSPFAKWLAIGLLPQLTVWIWFTVAIGMLFGLAAGALGRGRAGA
jgi:hypothetical protein